MTEAERKSLEDQLPEGWRIMVSVRQTAAGCDWAQERIQAVNDRHNVVLEGTWPWLLKKATSYILGQKGGH